MSLCMFGYYLLFFSSNVNCIVYTPMYVHIFSYLVNKLEMRWLYLSPIEKFENNKHVEIFNHLTYSAYIF